MALPVPRTTWWEKRRLLWALEQALAKQAERSDSVRRRAWQYRLYRKIADAVVEYPWARYWRAVHKQADDVPEEITRAFESAIAMIPRLWDEAAKSGQARAMVRRYDEIFARRLFEQGVQATMAQITGIDETLRSELRKTLREAMQEGKDAPDFARRVRQKWAGVVRERAELIAWTEWARGVETMSFATLMAGNVPYKVWITVGDSHVCPICAANAAQGPIPTQEAFQSSDLHGPAHPRCRCAVKGAMSPGDETDPLFEARQIVERGVKSADEAIELGAKIHAYAERRYRTLEQERAALLARIQAVEARVQKLWQRYDRTHDEAIMAQIDRAYEKLQPLWDRMHDVADRRKWERLYRETLAALRSLGGPVPLAAAPKRVATALRKAAAYYPAGWLKRAADLGPMIGKIAERGYYQRMPDHAVIALSGTPKEPTRPTIRVAVHELAHRMEHALPEIVELERQFYAKRTAGESLQRLSDVLPGVGYREDELVRPDRFLDPYMGKDYGGGAFELFSMGTEGVFARSFLIENDPEFLHFILGVLAGVP